MKFTVNQHVKKIKGYQFPGVIVASFYTVSGQERYVVECTIPEVQGMLHIFNQYDLELA